jgi:transcriptional regulator of acetoin/glycerol metabolism
MISSPELQLAHANAVRARGSALPPDGLPAPELLDSWVRCMQAGMDCALPVSVPVVEEADLRRRGEQNEVVRRLAQAELETLAQQIAGSNFLLAFADRDGVILDQVADNRFMVSGSAAAIVPGACWSEAACGTNGMGTALGTGRSVAVTGLEHFYLTLGDISCTATPVRDARGDIVGVLDASSYFESRQRHTHALVQMAATHIENGLLAHQMRRCWVLAIHPRPEFLATLSAGLLAFDDGGLLQAVNARGRQLLQGLDAVPGTAFESLFGESFELVLARLQRHGEQRLRDVMGSALVAACVGRPPARRTAPAVPHGLPPAAAAPIAARAALPAEPAAGSDPAVAEAYRMVAAAARLRVPILIRGETGSGKELLARHAHASSGRSGAFVAVNCGALPGELIEAELFGYVGGAFTGARREGSAGLIASADGGTLLLDEVRELPLQLQAALLRFLDDQTVRSVGATSSRSVDVLLLAATHADLEAEVAARRFRADLMYRLNTVRVDLPPLRERRDFSAAVRSTLAALDSAASIADDAIERLAKERWPGNFRELRSLLTRVLLQADNGARITRTDVERWLPGHTPAPASALQNAAGELVRREFERCGSVSQTARALGISRTTVYRHLKQAAARS